MWITTNHYLCLLTGNNVMKHNHQYFLKDTVDIILVRVADHFFATLIKKKIKFSSYIRKFKMEQLQSHIGLTKLRPPHIQYGEIFAHFLIYYEALPHILCDFATAPLWISLYEENLIFFFISVRYKDRFYFSQLSSSSRTLDIRT
jgi:hypothetical protein